MFEYQFTDVPLSTHWVETDFSATLWDDQYQVGRVYKGLGSWVAEPYWDKIGTGTTVHETEEEAKAFLLATYKFDN